MKRVLRYLKGTNHHGLFLKRNSPLTLLAFSGSDWGGVNDVSRATTSYTLYLDTNIVPWKSTCQNLISLSYIEAKYKALANAYAELMWIKSLLKELDISITKPPTLFCDNTSASYLCVNPGYHSRMKHIALDYHFIREQVSVGLLRVFYVHFQDQIVDMLTKPLANSPFLRN